jgi:alkanesulfonate monooxygenase SsuD/methylene tetrahydromethanopterin reductase-like flavin-dependent oxidoreductase (luciferase family)
MRVGVTVSDPDAVVAEAKAAEELGFDLIGCGEHVFFHGPTPNGFAMLAAAAAVTTSIRLVSSITLLPLYPAAVVAKLAAVVDRISEGRFELGLGSGGEYPQEFAAVGIDPATRFRRTEEGLEVLRLLFSGQRVTYEGDYCSLRDVRLDPAARQAGGPPIWLGGRKTGALRRVGRFADVWMPYMVEPRHVAEGLCAARDFAVEHGRTAGDVSGALFIWAAVDDDARWARDTGVRAVSAAYRQDFSALADRYLLVGGPEAVVARLADYREAGVETVLLQIAADDPRDRRRVLDNLARDVLPVVRSG